MKTIPLYPPIANMRTKMIKTDSSVGVKPNISYIVPSWTSKISICKLANEIGCMKQNTKHKTILDETLPHPNTGQFPIFDSIPGFHSSHPFDSQYYCILYRLLADDNQRKIQYKNEKKRE